MPAVRVHHLNCGTLRPLGGRLVNGGRLPLLPARIVCHCVLIEADSGLVLVDTGFGTSDIAHLKLIGSRDDPDESRVQRVRHKVITNFLLRAALDEETTAVRQVAALGHSPDDVRDIVMTHLDWDHAGGLADFPAARVHLSRTEYDYAMTGAAQTGNAVQSTRYWERQWRHGPDWVTYDTGEGDTWFGFEGVRALDGLPGLALVPLPGHTPGQCGVAVETETGRWLLHAADGYFDHRKLDPENPRSTPGLAAFEKVFEHDAEARRDTQARLRALRAEHGDEVEVFCTHDPVELDRYAGAARP